MEKVFKVTGFCPCKKCCWKTDGIISSKSPGPKTHHSVAAPNLYHFGTRIIKIDFYGIELFM